MKFCKSLIDQHKDLSERITDLVQLGKKREKLKSNLQNSAGDLNGSKVSLELKGVWSKEGTAWSGDVSAIEFARDYRQDHKNIELSASRYRDIFRENRNTFNNMEEVVNSNTWHDRNGGGGEKYKYKGFFSHAQQNPLKLAHDPVRNQSIDTFSESTNIAYNEKEPLLLELRKDLEEYFTIEDISNNKGEMYSYKLRDEHVNKLNDPAAKHSDYKELSTLRGGGGALKVLLMCSPGYLLTEVR